MRNLATAYQMALIMQVQAPKELHHAVFLTIFKLLPNLYCHNKIVPNIRPKYPNTNFLNTCISDFWAECSLILKQFHVLPWTSWSLAAKNFMQSYYIIIGDISSKYSFDKKMNKQKSKQGQIKGAFSERKN
jgi:hypothetical protein